MHVRAGAALFVGLLAACASAPESPTAGTPLLLGVEQDGRLLRPVDGAVVLARRPFTLVLRARPDEGVLVNASESPATVEILPFTDDLDELPGFRWTGMADGLGNPDRELWLSDDSPNCWYADRNGEHRYDGRPRGSPWGPLGRRTVAVLWKVESKERWAVADWPFPRLHLVFLRSVLGKKLAPPPEGYESMRGLLRFAVEKQGLTIRFDDALSARGR